MVKLMYVVARDHMTILTQKNSHVRIKELEARINLKKDDIEDAEKAEDLDLMKMLKKELVCLQEDLELAKTAANREKGEKKYEVRALITGSYLLGWVTANSVEEAKEKALALEECKGKRWAASPESVDFDEHQNPRDISAREVTEDSGRRVL